MFVAWCSKCQVVVAYGDRRSGVAGMMHRNADEAQHFTEIREVDLPAEFFVVPPSVVGGDGKSDPQVEAVRHERHTAIFAELHKIIKSSAT